MKKTFKIGRRADNGQFTPVSEARRDWKRQIVQIIVRNTKKAHRSA